MVMVALLTNLAIVSLACSTETAGGFLGRPLVEVEQQNFFKGFRLAEFAKRETPYNARVVIFKPAQTPFTSRSRRPSTKMNTCWRYNCGYADRLLKKVAAALSPGMSSRGF
jgi:hypothetical protein